MANVKVEVLDAVVNGKVKGEQLSVSEKAAEKLEKNGYVQLVSSKQKQSEKKDKAE